MKKILLAGLLVWTVGVVAAAEQAPDRLPADAPAELKKVKELLDDGKLTADETYDTHLSRAENIGSAFAALTGEAMNPLFGVTVRGAWIYLRSDDAVKDSLPWYCQPQAWGPLAALLLALFFKSTLCEAFPPLKKPLDALAALTHKAGAVASLPIVLAIFARSFVPEATATVTALGNAVCPAALAGEAGAVGGGDTLFALLGWAISLTLGLAVYAAVWLTFNVVEVLILISPFPAVDAALKSFRIAVIAALFGLRAYSPTAAALTALAIVLASFLIAGWSLRLTVFGWTYALDLLLLRSRRLKEVADGALAFSGPGLAKEMPVRTRGRLRRGEEGGLEFRYRPWLVLPERRCALPEAPAAYTVGSGMLNPYLVKFSEDRYAKLLRFPPRFKRHEEALAAAFALGGTRDISVAGSVRAMFAYLKALMLGRELPAAA